METVEKVKPPAPPAHTKPVGFVPRVYAWMLMLLLATAGVSAMMLITGMIQMFDQHWAIWSLMFFLLGQASAAISCFNLDGERQRPFQASGVLPGISIGMNGAALGIILAKLPPVSIGVGLFMSLTLFACATLYSMQLNIANATYRSFQHPPLSLSSFAVFCLLNFLFRSGTLAYLISLIAGLGALISAFRIISHTETVFKNADFYDELRHGTFALHPPDSSVRKKVEAQLSLSIFKHSYQFQFGVYGLLWFSFIFLSMP